MSRGLLSLVLSLLLFNSVWAEDPVHFDDVFLKDAVEQTLWISDPTPADMLALTELWCRDCRITDLTGLEYATNMETLWLEDNSVSDLTPVAGLSALRALMLEGNEISDLSPLSGLTGLRELNLKENQVSDISPLSGLSGLQTLSLHRNDVSDLSPLEALTCLKELDLRLNPLARDAWTIHIPQIIANNPGLQIWYDATYVRHLVISSTAGGSVVSPGEGDFTYEHETAVLLEAKADPCFVFARWTGTHFTSENPLSITISRAEIDQNLRANFLSIRDVLYVDDDAPGDPGPGDPAVSDPHESGAPEHPLDTIQEAVDVAGDDLPIVVAPGTYHENVDISDKAIRLLGYDPNDPDGGDWPVIDGGGQGPAVRVARGTDARCELIGLVITGGKAHSGAAVFCNAANLTLANCLVAGNQATDPTGAPVHCADSNVEFVSCTIADNRAGESGVGLYLVNSPAIVVNSILWGNGQKEIQVTGAADSSIRYSAVAGGWPGQGNLSEDPLFVQAGTWVDHGYAGSTWLMGDYHLRSQAGRWDAIARQWTPDAAMSPCIDAGDPGDSVGRECPPNGGIINMGAYGSTVEASRSQAGF
jgi:hypothetical protein